MEPGSAPWRVLETHPEQTPHTLENGSPGLPRAAIGAVVLAVLAAVAALLIVAQPRGEVVISAVGSPGTGHGLDGGTSEPGPVSGTPDLVVEVAGAVLRPGVYHLPAGARIGDAIQAAGGFGATVDVIAADRSLNLAAPVADGTEIRVPARGESPGAASAPPAEGAGAISGLVDLNHATAEALDALPGIGPATAAKIIAARDEKPFASLDELVARKVVSASTLAKLRSQATVTP